MPAVAPPLPTKMAPALTNPNLRQMLKDWAEENWFTDLTTRLQRLSPEFRQWWFHHEVRQQHTQPIVILHPQVGELLLERVTLHLDANQSFSARVLLPMPESHTTERLQELLSHTDENTPEEWGP